MALNKATNLGQGFLDILDTSVNKQTNEFHRKIHSDTRDIIRNLLWVRIFNILFRFSYLS